jgi:hypothetical protein
MPLVNTHTSLIMAANTPTTCLSMLRGVLCVCEAVMSPCVCVRVCFDCGGERAGVASASVHASNDLGLVSGLRACCAYKQLPTAKPGLGCGSGCLQVELETQAQKPAAHVSAWPSKCCAVLCHCQPGSHGMTHANRQTKPHCDQGTHTHVCVRVCGRGLTATQPRSSLLGQTCWALNTHLYSFGGLGRQGSTQPVVLAV